MTKIEVLRRAQTLGLHGVMSDDHGLYTCNECGEQWQARSRYLWWPIRLRWSDRRASKWLGSHGVEVEADGVEQRVFMRVWHLGRLKIIFGREPLRPSEAVLYESQRPAPQSARSRGGQGR